MFSSVNHRLAHYAILIVAWALLCLPNLGGSSLWDIDEGNNSEAAQEMYVSGNWIIPTFNYKLREDKPALLYWLQASAYHLFGVNEGSARLPSALAALLAVLLSYELARRMFGASAGLLAGLILVSAILFCAAGHFANPDALLTTGTLLSMTFFWWDYPRNGRRWMYFSGIATGLAVLAKGPVGLVLPTAILVLFLFWEGQLKRLWTIHWVGSSLLFAVTAVPWYVWVALETKGAWLKGFWLKHNQGRFLSPMENHSGPAVYYVGVLLVGLAPWSIFLVALIWDRWRHARGKTPPEPGTAPEQAVAESAACRFLLCWIAVYFVFFTVARTKLPNYILPLYPALAILLAQFLDRWRRGVIEVPRGLVHLSLAGLVLTGLIVIVGLQIAAGTIKVSAMRGRPFAGIQYWGALGLVPIAGALAAWWQMRRNNVEGILASVAATAIVFTGSLAAWGSVIMEPFKAPRSLAHSLPADQLHREVRIASYRYFQPSLVFYCKREVRELFNEQDAINHLGGPLPAFLFVPESAWKELESRLAHKASIVARRYDLYRRCEIVLVTNCMPDMEAQAPAEESGPETAVEMPGLQPSGS